MARASEPAPAPAGQGVQGAAGSAVDAVRGAGGRTFSSPADRTVVLSPAGGRSGSAAPAKGAQGVQGAQSAAAPWVSLDARAASAHSVELRTMIGVSETAALDVTIAWGDGATDTFSATVSGYPSDTRYTKHAYAVLGTYEVKVTVKDTTHGVEVVNQVAFTTSGAEFTPHTPTRLLDTRDGTGAARAKVAGRGWVALKVGGAAQIPGGVSAVALNVTVTNTTAPGHILVQENNRLYEEVSGGSNLNYAGGQSVSNLVLGSVGEDGYVHLYNAGWEPVDLIADVTGYFAPATASGYRALAPVRAVDTREGIGTAQGQVAGQNGFDVQIAGRNGVPEGITAVAVNLTVTNPQESGHLTAYPSGQALPTTSSVNFAAGQTVANAVIVPVGADGKITVRNGSWRPADVVVDVVGYYSRDSRSAFVAAWSPLRLLDSRKNSWGGRPAGPLAARDFYAMRHESDTHEPRVDGWALNTTVTNTKGPGFLSVAPDPNFWSDYQNGTQVQPERPVSSVLNWTEGATVANVAQTPGGKGGIVDIWNQGWQDIDFTVDLLGYYQTI